MSQRAIIRLDGEILTALCPDCKCCLPKGGHCAGCHTSMTIDEVCGCGVCSDLVDDFAEREAERIKSRRYVHDLKARAKNS
jgi:hypothetical protein